MVEDDARLLTLPAGVSSVVNVTLLSTSETHEAYDIVRPGLHGVVSYCYARFWGCLSADGRVVAYGEIALQGYHSGHIEHYNLPC